MKKLLGSLAVVAALSLPSITLACEGHEKTAMAKATLKNVSVTEVASLQKAKKAVIIDANGEDTRAKYGVIPDAKLLTNYARYDIEKELPAAKDTKLVFYCGSTKCSAAPKAAQRALEAGYTDVNVMPEGIMGWKQAGQPTASAVNRS